MAECSECGKSFTPRDPRIVTCSKECSKVRAKKTQKARNDRYYATNKEKVCENVNRYREANKEKIVESKKRYTELNRDGARARSSRWWKANKAQHKETCERWRQNNPDMAAAIKHRRRAHAAGAEGSYTPTDIAEIRLRQGGVCATPGCGCRKLTVDHIIPLSKGGSNWPGNIQLLCRPCNAAKCDRDNDEFMAARAAA
jgi:5-methylcytosine-specific restriction endonuclease McrA